MKILSIHDLATIRKRAEHKLSLREESNEKVTEKCCGLASGTQHLQILICGGTGCKASSSQGITEHLRTAIEKNGIADKVEVITVGCFGFCEKGPIVKIIPDNTFYTQVTPVAATPITGIVPTIVVPWRTPSPTESPTGAIWIIPTPPQ